MPKSLTRVSRTKKEHLSVDPSRGQFWKADPKKARQKGAHVSARGDDRSRLPAHAHTHACAYARCGGTGTRAPPSSFLGISPTRWRRCTLLSLFFFFLFQAGRLWEFGTCACLYTRRARGPCKREWWGEGGGILVMFRKRANVGGRRTTGGAKGGKTRQEWEDDRTCAIYGRHKAANPWEYRACASGPARGLHELYGSSFSLRVPLFYLRLLFARTAFRPAHGDFFFNTWLC